jgi:RHS repeat-associated protein
LDNGRYVYDAWRQHRRTFTKSAGSETQHRTYAYDCSHAFRGGFSAASYTYDPNRVQLSGTSAPTEVNPHQASLKASATTIVFRYYGFRYYQPSTGRWLSRDPFEERGGANLYGFVENGPVCAIDRLGLWTQKGVQAILCASEEGRWVLSRLKSGAFKLGSVDDWMIAFQTVDPTGHPVGPEGPTQSVTSLGKRINGTVQNGVLWIMSDLSDEWAAKDTYHEHDHTTLPDEPVVPYDQYLVRRMEHEILVRYQTESFAAVYDIENPKLPQIPLTPNYWVGGIISMDRIRAEIEAEPLYNPKLNAGASGNFPVPRLKNPVNPHLYTDWQDCCGGSK